MAADDALEKYRQKRDFERTSEPRGGERQGAPEPIFVIQKHAARRLHYDFRLEIGGTLKSWAIPKGPSTNPKEKRLAVPTEDHPLAYADFEGNIPPGQYGAGTVLVWDIGTFRNLTEKKGQPIPLEEAYVHGHLSIWLEGRKLQGAYALTRFKTGKEESWLLVKKDDVGADASQDILVSRPESALTGRTLEEVAAAGPVLGEEFCFH
ncbi:MAG: DNA polymerase ligase N-terminal domain-containing protein [Desulfobacca sp.]|uniref:DNA polymerase ligase N-terminal domain-containing protein n=1 Tax=Desulfobacca sp. TaxID=2067990 RepID=UPI00404B7173